jgi:hypothetical protein
MKKFKYVKLFENFQVNESILDKVKSAFGAELKTPKQFDTKAIDGKQLTSEQKEVKNKIIMVLNDLNSDVSDSYYLIKLIAVKLVDNGLVIDTYSATSELEKNLIAKRLKVEKTSKSSSTEMDVGDYAPRDISTTRTTMTITVYHQPNTVEFD